MCSGSSCYFLDPHFARAQDSLHETEERGLAVVCSAGLDGALVEEWLHLSLQGWCLLCSPVSFHVFGKGVAGSDLH